jgi:hypothetical protein
MKKLLLLSALLCLTFGSARAQLSSTITTQLHDPQFSLGRDFWLAIPSNEWGIDTLGTYIKIYITSASNTTAWVEYDATRDSIAIQSYKVSTFAVPESLEMESSGYPENKGIHIYSKDANLSVYFISHQPYSSDGSYIIPTIGWGTDYAVAAYGSLFNGGGTFAFDLPSECTVVAEEDNTQVTITPSCDCRQCMSGNDTGNAQASVVVFPQGQPQSFPLNRGQSVQLMPVKAQDADFYDMTGTIIHANQPVGVIGASMQPNIPNDFPYGDFVCEMIQPIRDWAETYYATSYYQPPGSPNHDFARYLFIGSVPNQTIFRFDCATGAHTEAVLGDLYRPYWDELELGQKFTSDAPFLCVSYINSSTYPDNNDGEGDPAEAMLNPRQQFTKTVVFATPTSIPTLVPYDNYVNIIVNIHDKLNTLFDGQSIVGKVGACIDDTFEMFTIPQVAPGAHLVSGDTLGVGVYVYGYGYDESYAYSSPDQVGTFHSPDTVAPIADTTNSCYQTFVHVADSGMLPDGVNRQSGLDAIWPDSIYNMTFQTDADWIEGSGADTSGYSVSVIDPTKPGWIKVEIHDLAGNLTTVTTIYKTEYAKIEPPLNNLGVWTAPGFPPGSPKIGYDTIQNVGQTTFDLTELKLLYGNVGFTLFDTTGGPLDLSPIPPGQRRVIMIEFKPVQNKVALDSIIISNGCEFTSAAVIGGGGANDFTVSDQSWLNELLPAPIGGYQQSVTISNLSSVSITIDSVWWQDTVHFKAVSTLPITLSPLPGTAPFIIAYFPDSNSVNTQDRTQGRWFSAQVFSSGIESPRTDLLTGSAAAPLSVSNANNPATAITILPTNDGRSLEIQPSATTPGPITLELTNVLGISVMHTTFGSGTQHIDVSALPYGVYFYHVTAGPVSQSGKVILGE